MQSVEVPWCGNKFFPKRNLNHLKRPKITSLKTSQPAITCSKLTIETLEKW